MPNTVSSLKQLLKQFSIFPKPVIAVIEQYLKRRKDESFNIELSSALCLTIPSADLEVLKELLQFLQRVADNETSNGMGRNQVAMAMRPSMQAFQNKNYNKHRKYPILRAFLSRK